MNTEPSTGSNRPLVARPPIKVEVQFAAAFPVEFVIQRLEDVSLWFQLQQPEASPRAAAAIPTLQPTQL